MTHRQRVLIALSLDQRPVHSQTRAFKHMGELYEVHVPTTLALLQQLAKSRDVEVNGSVECGFVFHLTPKGRKAAARAARRAFTAPVEPAP